MSLVVSQPTSNQTPDATLGGLAVTTPSNTGHASTTTSAAGEGGSQEKSCRWSGFQAVSGTILAITLKITHTSSGVLSGPSPTNSFALEYSLNGGSSWNSAVARSNFTASQGPTVFSVALSAAQDISQVQVRTDYLTDTVDIADAASITATIADIQLEVTVQDRVSPIVIL